MAFSQHLLRSFRLLAGMAVLSACSGTTGTLGRDATEVSRTAETNPAAEIGSAPIGSGTSRAGTNGPAGAPPGSCWSTYTSPAVIETVTVQVMTHPARLAPDGTVERPARFRRESRQSIVEQRRDSWFEIPCPALLTPDFIGSVQRALAVRGLYDGPISGVMDPPTRTAIRRYQQQDGFFNDELSLVSARKLGLIAIDY
ncbi:peptidoglycan-binding domain-containing protein [Phaeobacter sp.]|uniref:peptidoglycan-binding domain-containing protein n=1 Tax=Phaeobacter sp. TaxID=1902409 RepID=UPI0025D3F6F0|nr:peptidoglycan-binding domain-containing protein [Phaeobacter sp.]